MEPTTKLPEIEREATNKSLDVERSKTDAELLDFVADGKDKPDGKEKAPSEVAPPKEPSSADEKLSREREARRLALEALLHLEREETDRHLSLEREQADEVIAARDDVLGIVSHDLRNMLGIVALSAASLRDIPCSKEVEEAIARDASRIQRSTARMNRLIGDLLDVVSIEAGHLAITPAPHNPGELIRETLEAYQPLAASKNLTIVAHLDESLPLANYDPYRMLQVLANLVGNAIKFSTAPAEITIRARRIDTTIEISVTDTGIGIVPERLEVVFERFWQATKTQRAGLGLGLYISRWLVEAHGGKIWATSVPHQGSTFSFTIPLA